MQLAGQKEKVVQYVYVHCIPICLPPTELVVLYIQYISSGSALQAASGSLNPYPTYTVLYVKLDPEHDNFLHIWTKAIILKHSLDMRPDFWHIGLAYFYHEF